MNDTVKMIFGLIGGLALFLFGMNSMSENLQKVAGDKMKKILGFLTQNPVLGAVAGALVTAVLQSSSATTVIFSFGLLFEGIEIMGSVMKPLAGSPVFTDMMGKVAEIPVLGVVLGACMTLVVQSSSATIAVSRNFASQTGSDGVTSVIGLTGAIPILLGDNIGTTITVLLASIRQSQNARRTAFAHSIFNISGSIVFLCVIPLFARFVTLISPKGTEVEVISRQIANAHTVFNIVCTLIWLPLIPFMVKLVTFLARGKDKFVLESCQPKYLDEKVISQPMAAMYLVSNEINHCAELASDMLVASQKELNGKAENSDTFDSLYSTVKQLQEAVATYIFRMFTRGGLTESQSERAAGLLFVVNSIDRVADRFQEIVTQARRLVQNKKKLSDEAKKELSKCFDISEKLFHQAIVAVSAGDQSIASQTAKGRKAMRQAQKKFNKSHLARVKEMR